MDELMAKVIELAEENARLKAALRLVEKNYEHDKEKGYSSADEGEEILLVAGLLDKKKDINVITFDNCEDVAYGE